MTKAKTAAPTPRYVRHGKRPAWGVGRVVDVFQGLMRVRFSDGELREFRENVFEPVEEGEAPPELLALTDAPPPPPPRAPRKRAAAGPAKARASRAVAKSHP